MDILAHLLLAVVTARLFPKSRWAMRVIVLSALLPDIDYLSEFFGQEAYLHYRRGITHGILFLFSVPVVVGLVSARFMGGRKPVRKHFESFYMLSLMGYGGHIILDLFNSYGAHVFAPLDARYYSFGSVYSPDPVIIIVFVIGLFVSQRRKTKKKLARKILLTALIVCSLYLAGRTLIKQSALAFARGEMDSYIVKSVNPMPLSLWQWWYVAELPEGGKETGVVDLIAADVYKADTYSPAPKGKSIMAAKQTALAREFLHVYPDVYIKKGRDARGRDIITFKALSCSYKNDPKCLIVVYLNP